MKDPLLTLAIALAFALIYLPTATAQPAADNPLLRHIPADADQLFRVDLGSVFSKIDVAELLTTLHKVVSDPHQEPSFNILKGAFTAGVDLNANIFISVSNRFLPDSPKYIALLLPLTDSGKFLSYMRTQLRALHPFSSAAHARVMTSSYCAIACDRTWTVMIFRLHGRRSPGYTLEYLQQTNARKAIAAFAGFPNSYFATNPEFKKLITEEADFQLWNRSSTSSSPVMNKVFQLAPGDLGFNDLHPAEKSNHTPEMGSLHFLKGKVTYRNVRLGKTAEPASVNTSLIAGIPDGKLVTLLNMHLDLPALATSFEKDPGHNNLALSLAKHGLTAQDLARALDGDLMLLVYHRTNAQSSAMEGQGPAFYAVVTVKDTAAFNQLAAAYKLSDARTANLDRDTVFNHPFNYYTFRNDVAVISTTPQMTNDYFDHPGSDSARTALLLPAQLPHGSFALGIDIDATLTYFMGLPPNPNSPANDHNKKMAQILRKIETMSMSAGVSGQDGEEADIQLRMVDPDKNGLSVFLEMFGEIVVSGIR